ncbi:MAG: hypothetical protein IT429_12600 [Gemmataceae bacterium]|nr:hypothetical protein [Gemmataceae bacterium]
MTRIVVTSKVGPDGVLHLTLPVGTADANQEVRVTVEPVVGPMPTAEEWRRAVLATAGQWRGDFERPLQGDYEEREPLS